MDSIDCESGCQPFVTMVKATHLLDADHLGPILRLAPSFVLLDRVGTALDAEHVALVLRTLSENAITCFFFEGDACDDRDYYTVLEIAGDGTRQWESLREPGAPGATVEQWRPGRSRGKTDRGCTGPKLRSRPGERPRPGLTAAAPPACSPSRSAAGPTPPSIPPRRPYDKGSLHVRTATRFR